MRKKLFVLLLATLLLLTVFSACGPKEPPISTEIGAIHYKLYDIVSTFSDYVPDEGNALFLVYFTPDSADDASSVETNLYDYLVNGGSSQKAANVSLHGVAFDCTFVGYQFNQKESVKYYVAAFEIPSNVEEVTQAVMTLPEGQTIHMKQS
ncbi:MAG: hypothetical protein ACOYJC_07875 [Christensenellales bacterium]|jgi:hypothetical protein